MMTKLEIIKELFEDGYGIDASKRSVTMEMGCMYHSYDGRKCAVGMCMTNSSIKKLGRFIGDVYEINSEASLDTLLLKRYKGHDIGFWSDLQELHDENSYYSGHTFSKKGINQVKFLKRKYDENN